MQTDLDLSLAVLSAMITPAVLISACGSLLIATSNRLGRVIDRTRKISEQAEKLVREGARDAAAEAQQRMLHRQLDRTARRARLLQRAMSRLYVALAVFVATSVAIGVISLSGQRLAWLPLGLGLLGAAALFHSSLLLILESRVALSSVDDEMDFFLDLGRQHLPPEPPERTVQRRWLPRR